MKQYRRIVQLKQFYETYERYLGIGALLFGFVFDNLTLTRIDFWVDQLILFSYLTIVGACTLLLNLHDAGRMRIRNAHKLDWWLPLVMQFSIGNLFSGYVVFYSRSGSLAASWPFLLFLLFFFLGNEMFRSRYQRTVFRMSIFFIALFSFSIFFVPILLHQIGPWIFLLSGIVSVAVFALVVAIQSRIAPAYTRGSRPFLIRSVASLFLAFNFLYFTNIIPPIPLSIKELGIYHSVVRLPEGGYTVQYEPQSWMTLLPLVRETYTHTPGTSLYAYSAVFAPTAIEAKILHRWSRYDETDKVWRTVTTVGFPIVGGRDGGYRGYSQKSAIMPGIWRVDVVTERGQLLGRRTFLVVESSAVPDLEDHVR